MPTPFFPAFIGLIQVIRNVENPRKELEEHYYNPDHQHLLNLGYQPTHDIEAELGIMLRDLINYKQRIGARQEALIPDIRWDGTRRKVSFLARESMLKVANPWRGEEEE